MSKTFREWNVEQHWLLPPSVMDFVPADHIAHFVRDTVREQLDLSEVLASYEKEERGYPPYNPVMMTALLLYAYCQGVYSSRRIAHFNTGGTNTNWNVYLLGDQQLSRPDPGLPYGGWYGGFSVMESPSNVNVFRRYYEVRLYDKAPYGMASI